MLGQVLGGRSGSSLAGRYFQYEVVGLRQSEDTDNNGYQIRSSASVFITVPYSRMNDEMQRITRLGGKIVSIQAIGASNSEAEKSEAGKSGE